MLIRIFLFFFVFNISSVYANCDFKSGDFINELNNPKNIKEIKIETPNSRKFYRNQLDIMTSNEYVIQKKLKKYHKANINVIYDFGQCFYKAKIRQHGDWKDHIILDAGTPISSLRINLKNGNIINAVKFSLLIPDTRNDLNEVLGSLLLKNIGFIVPETFQVKTNINGKKLVMLFQEIARKELLERNNKREGPILEGDESILWSKEFFEYKYQPISLSRVVNEKWFLKGKNYSKITLDAFEKLQIAYLEHGQNIKELKYVLINPNQNNNKLFSKYFFSLLALNGEHALVGHNRKFYYNLFTEKFEPIYYDGNLSLQKKIDIKIDKIVAAKNFYKIKSNKYEKNFTKLDNKKILKDFKDRTIIDNKKKINFFKKSMVNIQKNEDIIDTMINSTKSNDFWSRNFENDYKNYLLNLNELKKLKQITIKKKIENKNSYTFFSIDNEELNLKNKDLLKIISRNKFDKLRYVYLPSDIIEKQLNEDTKIFANFADGYLKYSKSLSIKIDPESKIINLVQKKEDDWILFVNVNLKNWTILFEGVDMKNNNSISSERINSHGLTGCLNIYRSTFSNLSIKVNNGICEDSLNIINSKGSIKNININNAFSDGLDVDFSIINFENISIKNAKNDCVDVSAGNYDIAKIMVAKCSDKGVSIGEKSNINIQNLEVNNSLIGLSSKDLSKTYIKKAIFKNVKNCFEVFKKKQEFGGSILKLDNIISCKKYFVDVDSRILNN